MSELVFTHRCPRDFGGLMTSTVTCQKRLKMLKSRSKMAGLTQSARWSMEKCEGCTGPEKLAEPVLAEPKKGENKMSQKGICKCGKPKGRNKKGGFKSLCDDCQRERAKATKTPEALAKAAATRTRNQEAREAALREAAKAEVRAELFRDMVGQAKEARDELVITLGDPNAVLDDVAPLAKSLVQALDVCGSAGAIQGWE